MSTLPLPIELHDAPGHGHGRFVLHELTHADLPALQALFEHNDAYFELVHGMPARPDEAQREFDDRPPPHLPHGQVHFLRLIDERGALAGVVVWVADFVRPAVWHLGLFMLDPDHHGGGLARALWPHLEHWAARMGARWLRLSIVQDNRRAARFWARNGFVEVRRRDGVPLGQRVCSVAVGVKPLDGGSIEDYLAQMPRDRPGSTLP